MPNDNLKVTFLSHHRQPQCAPNPAYPEGVDVDLTDGEGVTCSVPLPYPAECCGVWIIRCATCGSGFAVTAAGRIDDPRSVKLPCHGIHGAKQ